MKLDCCTPFSPSTRGALYYHARNCPLTPNTKVTPEQLSKQRHPAGKGSKPGNVVKMDQETRDRLHVARNRPWGCGHDGCVACYGSPFDEPGGVPDGV